MNLPSYLLAAGVSQEEQRISGLRDCLQVTALPIDQVKKLEAPALVVVPGALLNLADREMLEGMLQRQVDVLLLAPFPYSDLSRWLPVGEVVTLEPASFGNCRAVDLDLQQMLGQAEVRILYQYSIRLSAGRPLLATSTGTTVLAAFQPKGSWGCLLVMSLLLGSLSARSVTADKERLATGLGRWLAKRHAIPSKMPLNKAVASETAGISRISLLAVAMAGCLVPPSSRAASGQTPSCTRRGLAIAGSRQCAAV